jgi:hypothetical protein
MIGQLQHLLAVGRQSNITIVVVPNRMGHYSPALYGSFVIFESADRSPMVQLESSWSSTILSNMRAINSYRAGAVDIVDRSLGVEKSAALIEEIMREMEARP